MYPKMLTEVIEAIETHFDDEKEVKVDCMLYLYNALARTEDVVRMEKWFEDNNICECCGGNLMLEAHKEPHTEIGQGVYEVLYEAFCPQCDRGDETDD